MFYGTHDYEDIRLVKQFLITSLEYFSSGLRAELLLKLPQLVSLKRSKHLMTEIPNLVKRFVVFHFYLPFALLFFLALQSCFLFSLCDLSNVTLTCTLFHLKEEKEKFKKN